MKRKRKCMFIVALAMMLICHISSAQYKIPKSVFGNGGMKIANTSHGLVSTLGQPLIGKTSNSTTAIHSGFWNEIDISVGVEDINNPIISNFELMQNYPNPYNPATTIEFSLPTSEHVSLKVFSLLGQEVATLVNGKCSAGTHKVIWDAGDLASGVYFYILQAGNYREVRKAILMK